MLNQFSRTQLLIGKEAMDRLSKTRVAIFGIGGVGGYTAEALARSGVGELDLIDDDKVCLTNINRQIFATRKTVGKYKVDVAEERLKDINPDIIINKYRTFYTPETSENFDFSKYDYVVDAIDTVTGKIELTVDGYGHPQKLPRRSFRRVHSYAGERCASDSRRDAAGGQCVSCGVGRSPGNGIPGLFGIRQLHAGWGSPNGGTVPGIRFCLGLPDDGFGDAHRL